MQKKKYCPNCNSELIWCFDSYGYTPLHLHCFKCNINIGATSRVKCIELFDKYHRKDTTIEFYHNKIQLVCIPECKFLYSADSKESSNITMEELIPR